MGKILLEKMEFYAYHGHFKEEQKIGGKYLVDLELETNFDGAVQHDELDGTVNYAEVYELVKNEMEIKSKLIEHLAGRILKVLLREFKTIKWARVKVSKVNPPIGAQLEAVAVVLEQKREG